MTVEVPFLEDLSGLGIVNLFDAATVITLRVKTSRNKT